MTDIIFRFYESGMTVYSVHPDYVEYSTEPCTDIILSFDKAGKFLTAQLMKRNEEQSSGESEVTN